MTEAHHHLDTSVVLRLLTGQPQDQFQTAVNTIRHLQTSRKTIGLSSLALYEAYFALQYHYTFSKKDAILALREFLDHSGIAAPKEIREILNLPNVWSAKPGFVDRLILADAMQENATLLTFEHSAARLSGVTLLKALS